MRWWDGVGWTEHLALPEVEPEPEPEPEGVSGLGAYIQGTSLGPRRLDTPVREDDGLLHPRAKDVVFAGAPRGTVDPPSARTLRDKERLLGPIGAQVGGAVALTILCWFLAISRTMGSLGDGVGVLIGISASLGVLIPVSLRIALRVQARMEFWRHWCYSRGFEPGKTSGPGSLLPKRLDRSPLLGASEERAFEYVGRRELVGRDVFIGSVVRRPAVAVGVDVDDEAETVPDAWRMGVAIMRFPPPAAARWAGASIRADHMSRRPIVMRSMLGGLIAPSFAECRAHLATLPTQDPRILQMLVDPRLDQYLAEHPMDIDIVGDLLVITRDGSPDDADTLDELCRDALVIHELLVADHEVEAARPKAPEPVVALPVEEDEPVVDMTREGWGGGEDDVQYYEAA